MESSNVDCGLEAVAERRQLAGRVAVAAALRRRETGVDRRPGLGDAPGFGQQLRLLIIRVGVVRIAGQRLIEPGQRVLELAGIRVFQGDAVAAERVDGVGGVELE